MEPTNTNQYGINDAMNQLMSEIDYQNKNDRAIAMDLEFNEMNIKQNNFDPSILEFIKDADEEIIFEN